MNQHREIAVALGSELPYILVQQGVEFQWVMLLSKGVPLAAKKYRTLHEALDDAPGGHVTIYRTAEEALQACVQHIER